MTLRNPTSYTEDMSNGTATNKGVETEDLIESICSVMFLKDFVVRNPKFKKQSGQEKEFTDILIPFEDTIISIQAKSKVINTKKAKPEVILKRITKVIDEGIGQLRNTRLIVDAGKTLHYKNAHGIDIPLNSSVVARIHGVVIANIYGNGDQLNVPGGFERKHNMPIHIFSAADFDAISSEIDTIPDLIHYLDTRAALFKLGKVNPDVNELDLLTIYKTKPELVEKTVNTEGNVLIINDGIWEGYINDHEEDIMRRNKLNKLSYLVDSTIQELVKTIDYSPGTLNPATGEPAPKSTKLEYWHTVYELSKLTRLQRRALGNKMAEKMERAATDIGIGYTLLMTNDKEAVLFMSSNKGRQERIRGLYNLASIAYVSKGLDKITAIATEPINDSGRSFDLVLLDGVTFENADEILEAAKTTFSAPKRLEGYEYEE